ncbi:MAG TPA: polysaccharide biosynthesis tyrosine autokinase [Solirubrobacteraceae bacterium]|nr:polysaccharide biosynthesis tyrosine autokinase [Solirubrobacteraceae bacterium]
MTSEATGQGDPRKYLRILWRWKFLFLAVTAFVPIAAVLLHKDPRKHYRSSTLLQFQPVAVNTSQFTVDTPITATQSILAVARLVKTTGVADAAAKLLHPPAAPRDLLRAVSVTPNTEAGFITISARDRNAARAAEIANAFGSAIVANRAQTAAALIDRSIASASTQLASRRTNQAGRTQLSEALVRLRALRAAQSGDAQVIESAVPSSKPVANSTTSRRVGLGLLIGLLLGVGAVVLAEAADRRIRTPEELEEMTDLPLLSAIPPHAFGAAHNQHDDEAFRMLRGALTYFNVDHRLSSVVVTSPQSKDGKTTVAIGLAVAAAQASKRVIVVDADLRRPQVCTRLGIESTAGLGAVLAGELPLSEALVEYPIETSNGGRLLVFAAGAPPPNPSELLGSQRMRVLLSQLEAQSDLVIVDTAAALAVSDPLPLLQSASGVVLVARMNRTRRDAVARLKRVITTAQGTILGVVGTAAGPATSYPAYDSSYALPSSTGDSAASGDTAGDSATAS